MRTDLYENLAGVEDAHWWFVSRRRIVLEVLAAHVRRGEGALRILDVGAGTGATTVALAELGDVDALECAPEALEHLRRRAGVRVLVGSLPGADLPEATYDVVTALDVLEHVEDDRHAVERIVRTLVPGGILLCTVPAHPWLWSNFDVACHHFRRYRPSELEALMRGAGLAILFSSPFQTLLFPLFVIERLSRRVVHRSETLVAPHRLVNRVFETVFSAERRWLGRGRRAPFGASHLVVAQRLA